MVGVEWGKMVSNGREEEEGRGDEMKGEDQRGIKKKKG